MSTKVECSKCGRTVTAKADGTPRRHVGFINVCGVMTRQEHSGEAVKPAPVDDFPFEDDEPVAREYGPAADTFTCSHGVTFIGGDDDSECDACYEESQALEAGIVWRDFPDDSRFFDEDSQRELAEYDASEFGLAMAANREARLEREAADEARSAGLVRVARAQRWALKVTGGSRRD